MEIITKKVDSPLADRVYKSVFKADQASVLWYSVAYRDDIMIGEVIIKKQINLTF